ncbi:MAG TPA: NADPH-dependent FMN reductase [Solirubrobacteraceae bacterium]|nr:NADPH-dependent FMN reductase [Solirubrobacteraceae bacterium]
MDVVMDRGRVTFKSASPGPLIVGIGGTARPNSSTERLLRLALLEAEGAGARTRLFAADKLELPPYDPVGHALDASPASELIDALAVAAGVVIASPGYHGGISGQLKNAIDYIEDLREADPPYLEGRAVGIIVCASGWQATATTLASIRSVVHALRGWPTPLGVAVNSGSIEYDDHGVPAGPLRDQVRIMIEQVVGFVTGSLAGSAAGFRAETVDR